MSRPRAPRNHNRDTALTNTALTNTALTNTTLTNTTLTNTTLTNTTLTDTDPADTPLADTPLADTLLADTALTDTALGGVANRVAYARRMGLLDERAFDFWIGEWDCTFEGGHAVNTITREFEGNVLVERFAMDAPQVWNGTSVSVFHPKLHIWQQTWVDQGGAYWHFVGQLVDGDPAFATAGPVDDPSLHKRMVFSDITADSFQWRWESSPDATAWTENWAITYERRT